MEEEEQATAIPAPQKMDRKKSIVDEHKQTYKAALERAVSLNVPYAFSPSYGTFDSDRYETDSSSDAIALGSGEASGLSSEDPRTQSVNVTIQPNDDSEDHNGNMSGFKNRADASYHHRGNGLSNKAPTRTNWDEVIDSLFTRTKSGKLVIHEGR